MKISSVMFGLFLLLAFSCVLPGCRKKPEQSKAEDKGQDAASRIIIEAMRPPPASPRPATSTSPVGSPQTPAGIVLNASPTPPLSRRLGLTGTPFTSLDGRFSIILPPGFPTFKYEHKVGNYAYDIYASDTSRGSFRLGYFLPQTEGQTGYDLLDGTLDRTAREWNWKIEAKERITVQGHPALSAYCSDGPSYIRINLVDAQPRLFAFEYFSTDRADLDKPDIDAYFKSFTLFE